MRSRLVGDSNNDGVFNSSDIVDVFSAAECEDNVDDNSTFDEGDWNGDRKFNSEEFVFAFQVDAYTAADLGMTPNPQIDVATIAVI